MKLQAVKANKRNLGVTSASLTQEAMMLHFHLNVCSVLVAVR
jgi:hypothetical protein